MTRWLLLALAAVMGAGCTDTRPADGGDGSTEPPVIDCVATLDCPFGWHCESGVCTREALALADDDGCRGDDDCPEGRACAPATGDCLLAYDDPEVVPDPRDDSECEAGELRACGSKLGACQYGHQLCVDGRWDPTCLGGVAPADQEQCNGLDDDCDGALPDDERDADSDGVAACAGDCHDGDPLVINASDEVCDGHDNDCDGHTDEDGSALCDDGDGCSGTERCEAGQCVPGTPIDCSHLGEGCYVGQCDPNTGGCRAVPARDGETCSDGRDCTERDHCQSGLCVGTVKTCAELTNDCSTGRCDPDLDTCVADPKPPDTPCDDQTFCTEGDHCQDGECIPGPIRDCNAPFGSCRRGVCDLDLDRCTGEPVEDGTDCDDGYACTEGDACDDGVCVGAPADCSHLTVPCVQGVCREQQGGCVGEPAACDCNPAVDSDEDGANECDDCDDKSGAVHPGADERCNGVDDDCDGDTDEGFDGDTDGFVRCGEPGEADCDDADPQVNPEADERCGSGGAGDGIDDDCDGYTDEGCGGGCSTADPDHDGVSECDGDCAPTDPRIFAGAEEQCDGLDNDCNAATVDNCGVGEACNWESGADDCEAELLCACMQTDYGTCSGYYQCTSMCNASFTGALGDGCAPDQACMYQIIPSANLHGCGGTQALLGDKRGGEACVSSSECRSGACEPACYDEHGADQLCEPNLRICRDYCSSDAYCPTEGTFCRVLRDPEMRGRCWPADGPWLGAGALGASCGYDDDCASGFCNDMTSTCASACCHDADCGEGFHCSLRGDAYGTDYVEIPAGAPACVYGLYECPQGFGFSCLPGYNLCGYYVSESAGLCLPDPMGGLGDKRAGQACSQNADCRSNFCERTLGVCVELCCHDGTCPEGLACRKQQTHSISWYDEYVSPARICVSPSAPDRVWMRK